MTSCVFFLLTAVPVHAEDAVAIEDVSLEALLQPVVTAAQYEQKQSDAPSAVTVVSGDEIRKFGYRILDDILRSLRGVSVVNDRNYDYVGVRGFGIAGDYNTRILLLVDGHRMNDAVYDQMDGTHAFPVDVDLIDRVEFVRGPSSSVYGSNALLAVVNVITKKGSQLAGLEGAVGLGSLGSQQARASYGGRVADVADVLLSTTFGESDGQSIHYFPDFDAPETKGGYVRDRDGERYGQFWGSAAIGEFVLRGGWSQRIKEVPTAAFNTVFGDARLETRDTRGLIDLAWAHQLGEEGPSLAARAFWDSYIFRGDYPLDYREAETDPPLVILNRDKTTASWWGAQLHVSQTFLDDYTLLVGASFRDQYQQDQKNIDVDTKTVNLDSRRRTRTVGTYAQAEAKPVSWLSIMAGLRHDYYFEGFGSSWNPRASIIVRPLSNTNLKLLYGTAFRAPNAYERFYEYAGLWAASPNLEPERIKTYEIVVEQFIGKNVSLLASGYYYRLEDLIGLTTDAEGIFSNQNQGDAEAVGAELEAFLRLGGLQARASYALQRTQDPDTKEERPNSPRHLGKLGLIAPLVVDRVDVALDAEYVGVRKVVNAGSDADPYVLASATILLRDLVPGLSLRARVRNLLDDAYEDPASEEHRQRVLVQDGRTFWVDVGYHY